MVVDSGVIFLNVHRADSSKSVKCVSLDGTEEHRHRLSRCTKPRRLYLLPFGIFSFIENRRFTNKFDAWNQSINDSTSAVKAVLLIAYIVEKNPVNRPAVDELTTQCFFRFLPLPHLIAVIATSKRNWWHCFSRRCKSQQGWHNFGFGRKCEDDGQNQPRRWGDTRLSFPKNIGLENRRGWTLTSDLGRTAKSEGQWTVDHWNRRWCFSGFILQWKKGQTIKREKKGG